MKKLLQLVALAAVAALMAFPAAAADEDPGCAVAGGEQVASGTVVSCTFTAQDVAAHGYTASTPNAYTICVDPDNDGCADEGENNNILVSNGSANATSINAGQLTVAAGSRVRIEVVATCVPGDYVCGWIGQVSAA